MPIVLGIYFIAIEIAANQGAEWALSNQTYLYMNGWFHYAKLYAAAAGLDPLMESYFQEEVRRLAAQGKAILLSSHILSEVEKLCDSISIIKEGRVIESGKLSDMRHLRNSETLEDLFMSHYDREPGNEI